jgi:hypothetical protein
MKIRIVVLLMFFYTAASAQIGQTYFREDYQRNSCKLLTNSNFTWVGECSDGYAQGDGIIYYLDNQGNRIGDRFEGHLWNGKKTGFGKMFYSSGRILYQGNWANNQKNGYGTMYYDEGRYEGNWKDNERSGRGKYYQKDGAFYDGQWDDDAANGYGRFVAASGQVSEGYFKNGAYVGAGQTSFTDIDPDTRGFDTVAAGGISCWRYKVPANMLSVFTLKNATGYSDFDIYVYADEAMTSQLNSGTNSGTQTELITIPIQEYDRYVYVKVVNAGNVYSVYNLYPHAMDFQEIAKEAFVETSEDAVVDWFLNALAGNDNKSNEDPEKGRNMGRAMTIFKSALQGKNFGGISKDLAINEISTRLKDACGNSFAGNFLVNFSIKIVGDMYKFY